MKFDSDRMAFLRALRVTKGVLLTHFEEKFVLTALRCQPAAPLFSDKQRAVIEEMWKKYGHQLHLPVAAFRKPFAVKPQAR